MAKNQKHYTPEFKQEEIYLHTYQDFKESMKAVFEYIEACTTAKGYTVPLIT